MTKEEKAELIKKFSSFLNEKENYTVRDFLNPSDQSPISFVREQAESIFNLKDIKEEIVSLKISMGKVETRIESGIDLTKILLGIGITCLWGVIAGLIKLFIP